MLERIELSGMATARMKQHLAGLGDSGAGRGPAAKDQAGAMMDSKGQAALDPLLEQRTLLGGILWLVTLSFCIYRGRVCEGAGAPGCPRASQGDTQAQPLRLPLHVHALRCLPSRARGALQPGRQATGRQRRQEGRRQRGATCCSCPDDRCVPA